MFESQCAAAKNAVDQLAASAEAAVSELNARVATLTAGRDTLTAQLSASESALAEMKAAVASPLAVVPRIERELQARSGWIQPSNAGDTGGSSDKQNGTFVMAPGEVATFSAAGAYAYNNGYWYYRLGPQPSATRFLFRFAVQLPTDADVAACQAVEFELQQTIAGVVYNMAWQAPLLEGGQWRTFDYANHVWLGAGVPLDKTLFSAGKWLTIERIQKQILRIDFVVGFSSAK